MGVSGAGGVGGPGGGGWWNWLAGLKGKASATSSGAKGGDATKRDDSSIPKFTISFNTKTIGINETFEVDINPKAEEKQFKLKIKLKELREDKTFVLISVEGNDKYKLVIKEGPLHAEQTINLDLSEKEAVFNKDFGIDVVIDGKKEAGISSRRISEKTQEFTVSPAVNVAV